MSYSLDDPGSILFEGVLTRRVFAWCIDVILITILVAIAWTVIFTLGVLTLGLGFVFMAVLPVIGFLYHLLFVAGSRAATPGQSLLDLTVRREEDLGRPGLLRALVFTIGLWITLASFFLLLLIAPFTPRKRALHDIVAGVVVLRNWASTHRAGSLNMGFGTVHR